MRLTDAVLLLGLVVPVLVACNDARDSDTASPGADAPVGTPADLETPVVPQEPISGGDSSQIELLALTAAQLETVDLPGELACAFADADLGTLLVARADALPDGMVRAVISNNGYTEMLANGEAGGFNDLVDGITLTGKGLTVLLEREEPRATGDESTRHAARLLVQRADGQARDYDGELTCGP